MRSNLTATVIVSFCTWIAAGCSSPSARPSTAIPDVRPRFITESSSQTPIKHVVIIVQENRSLDNIFAGYPGADAPTFGYKHDGTKVKLRSVDFGGPDLEHSFSSALTDYNDGKMNGFDVTSPSNPDYPYSFVDRNDVKPYWTMAQSYVLADRMFPTELGASFTAHLDLISGTSKLSPELALKDYPSNKPWGCDAPAGTTTTTVDSQRHFHTNGPFPCLTQFKTMAATLDSASIAWKFYAVQVVGCTKGCDAGGIWSTFDAIKKVRYGPDWQRNIVYPQTTVLSDIANGDLAAVSWVMPDWKDSDHPGSESDRGPSWVAAVVNAIGNSQYWKSTAVVVVWDDWGGWYDDAPPAQLDFVGLAVRVPCLIISPYPKSAGYVSHTQYEFGSILKFVEETFKLPSLDHTDKRASSISDSFDFSRPPLTFKTIPAKYPPPSFLHERPSLKPPDDD